MKDSSSSVKGLDFRTLFESAPGLNLVLMPDLKIVAASDAYLQATMTKREEILSRHLFDVFPNNPDDLHAVEVRNLFLDSVQRVLKYRIPDTMAVQRYDIRRPESKGGGFEERYWSTVNSPVFGKNREVTYIILRVEDVTEFIRLKQQKVEQTELTEKLKVQAEQMELEIFLRSNELASTSRKLEEAVRSETQVKKLNEELRKIAEMKSTFIAMVSHELRTPLTAIRTAIEMIVDGSDGPINQSQAETLKIAQRNIDRLSRLVNNVLGYTRLEAGKLNMRFEKVDLSSLCREVYDFMKIVSAEKSIETSIELPASPLFVVCDPDLMRDVILNLMDNAIKYTGEHGRIKARLCCNGKNVQLEIEDTGIGIPKEEEEKIFDVFYQATSQSTWKIGGTGIGLALCRLIMDGHHGSISVSSFPGKGSRFTLIFPSNPLQPRSLYEQDSDH